MVGDTRRFAGARKALAFFFRERARRAGLKALPCEPRIEMPRILAALERDEATYAALAACWRTAMDCDREGKPGLLAAHRRVLEQLHLGRSHGAVADSLDVSLKQLGRIVDHAMSVLAHRYRSRGLLSED